MATTQFDDSPVAELAAHPYRSLIAAVPAACVERSPDSLRLALGVLASVSSVQLGTAFHHAGLLAAQTILGAACLGGALIGLIRKRRRR
jgi:hypothetical protein